MRRLPILLLGAIVIATAIQGNATARCRKARHCHCVDGPCIFPAIPATVDNPDLRKVEPNSVKMALAPVTKSLVLSGQGFQSGAVCDFGKNGLSKISVVHATVSSATQITVVITIEVEDYIIAKRDVTVTNPDGHSTTLKQGFTVNSSPFDDKNSKEHSSP
jgi:hypothetical protein